MSIAIAIGFDFLKFFMMWGRSPPYEKIEQNKANDNGNAHANFDWYLLVLFFKMVCPHLACPHLSFSNKCFSWTVVAAATTCAATRALSCASIHAAPCTQKTKTRTDRNETITRRKAVEVWEFWVVERWLKFWGKLGSL